MPIKIQCPKCDMTYRLADETAGKKVRCKECGKTLDVPARDDEILEEIEEVEEVEEDEEEESSAKSRRSRKPNPTRQKSRRKSKNKSGSIPKIWIGVGAGIALLLLLLVSILFSGRKDPNATVLFPVAQVPVPSFPDLGAPRILQPSGVRMWFIRMPISSSPGLSMGMRLYLPPKDAPPQSIPCVLVAPAGTNLLVGNDMDADDYHAETLPYAQAGMAVVFYSLDGGVANMDNATDAQIVAGYQKFKAAYAGIVNGRNALEFVLAKVPQVNPRRIYTAGHSSAGTVSLLMAEHEPRLAGAIAFAPCSDVETRLAPATGNIAMQMMMPGLTSFVKRSSPRTHLAQTNCPVFLFHANDDDNVPVTESQTFAQLLKAAGKSVELQTVPAGGHYDPMVQEGIQKAITWLNSLNVN